MLTLCVFEGHFCISQNYAVLATNPTTECCTTRNLLEADLWTACLTMLQLPDCKLSAPNPRQAPPKVQFPEPELWCGTSFRLPWSCGVPCAKPINGASIGLAEYVCYIVTRCQGNPTPNRGSPCDPQPGTLSRPVGCAPLRFHMGLMVQEGKTAATRQVTTRSTIRQRARNTRGLGGARHIG